MPSREASILVVGRHQSGRLIWMTSRDASIFVVAKYHYSKLFLVVRLCECWHKTSPHATSVPLRAASVQMLTAV
jgi:hypothetical protein